MVTFFYVVTRVGDAYEEIITKEAISKTVALFYTGRKRRKENEGSN